MKIMINGKEIDKDCVYVNTGLNFGRFDFHGIQIDSYKITLTPQELILLIEKDYNLIRDEIQNDDKTYNELSEFSEINYGSLFDLLNNSKVFFSIIKTYLDRLIFTKLFQQTHKTRFIINSTDFVFNDDNKIEITGRCYQKM